MRPSESIRDAARGRTEGESQLEQPVAKCLREGHPGCVTQLGEPVDEDHGAIPLVVLERVEPLDDLVMQFDLSQCL